MTHREFGVFKCMKKENNKKETVDMAVTSTTTEGFVWEGALLATKPQEVSPIVMEMGREDLNLLKEKINEVIALLNKTCH